MKSAGDQKYTLILGLTMLVSGACKKPYTPSIVAANNNYLVVEGVINSGQDSTVIMLSRTVNIAGKTTANPETGAQLYVQSDQNTSYSLKETKPGRYVSSPLNLDNSRKYQLKIATADNRAYQSDFVAVQVTPPIDTLYYAADNNGLKVFSAAHDPKNNTRYYRWDYTETYIYVSGLNTYYKFDDSNYYAVDKSVLRKPSEYINICYNTDTSTTIILNSSAKLSQDVISLNPITQVSSTSEKVARRYSILVKQYALTKDSYEFWNLLKTNTQNLGTIFDAQPSEINGNIHCITIPSEPVIGYLSVCTVSQKRIFIDRTELPVWPYIPTGCLPFTVSWLRSGTTPVEFLNGIEIPLGPINSNPVLTLNKPDTAYSVSAGYYNCVDCRYHGGTTIVPDFWK